jgi:hypothetical protein
LTRRWNVSTPRHSPAKSLGEQLHARLGGQGLACTRLSIIATTEQGQTYSNPVGIALPIMNVEPKKVTGRCPQVGQPASRFPRLTHPASP